MNNIKMLKTNYYFSFRNLRGKINKILKMDVNMLINGYYVTKIISFKEYMEDICQYKVIKDINTSIYQTGYFLNPNKGYMHISNLGNPSYISCVVRNKKINEILND